MGVMLNTDDVGETKLRVCNIGTTPIELEFGVELFQLRPAPKDAYEIAHIPDEVRALLSDEHQEILLAMTQASDMSSGAYCARTYRPPNGYCTLRSELTDMLTEGDMTERREIQTQEADLEAKKNAQSQATGMPPTPQNDH